MNRTCARGLGTPDRFRWNSRFSRHFCTTGWCTPASASPVPIVEADDLLADDRLAGSDQRTCWDRSRDDLAVPEQNDGGLLSCSGEGDEGARPDHVDACDRATEKSSSTEPAGCGSASRRRCPRVNTDRRQPGTSSLLDRARGLTSPSGSPAIAPRRPVRTRRRRRQHGRRAGSPPCRSPPRPASRRRRPAVAGHRNAKRAEITTAVRLLRAEDEGSDSEGPSAAPAVGSLHDALLPSLPMRCRR